MHIFDVMRYGFRPIQFFFQKQPTTNMVGPVYLKLNGFVMILSSSIIKIVLNFSPQVVVFSIFYKCHNSSPQVY